MGTGNMNFTGLKNKRILLIAVLGVLLIQNQGFSQKTVDVVNPPRIVEFLGDQPMTRVGRPFVVLVSISNPAKVSINVTATLKLPDGMRLQGGAERQIKLSSKEKVTIRWTVFADEAVYGELVLEVADKLNLLAVDRLPVRFLPSMEKMEVSYIPRPVPVKKDGKLLVGAHYCHFGWKIISKDPITLLLTINLYYLS